MKKKLPIKTGVKFIIMVIAIIAAQLIINLYLASTSKPPQYFQNDPTYFIKRPN